ncbi:hypothetical protein [Flavobacterium sp.]|uniref:hypothetical protein n=1 Tax=Flavobacterium sp. TaxID=239 RepID=UPI00286E98B2|nr:hypothetical protein [Flavobacterium sp.]
MEVYPEIEEFELQLNESAKGFLKEAAKWAYFLSILGYIGIGFIVVAAIFAGAIFTTIGHMMPLEQMGMFSSALGIIMTVVYLLLAALYFFPIYYLNRFASNLKTALKDNNSETLANSFEYLKSHYKFIGIFALIILCFYAFIIVFISIAAIANGLR